MIRFSPATAHTWTKADPSNFVKSHKRAPAEPDMGDNLSPYPAYVCMCVCVQDMPRETNCKHVLLVLELTVPNS